MSRTSASAVQAILGNNYDGTTDLTPAIETAGTMADEVVACAAKRNVTQSAALLERIEAFLAAHYYGLQDQFYQSKSTEKASATFQGQTGMGLDATLYGQTAKSLDTSGCLVKLSNGVRRVGGVWLGKPKSEQTEYLDRD